MLMSYILLISAKMVLTIWEKLGSYIDATAIIQTRIPNNYFPNEKYYGEQSLILEEEGKEKGTVMVKASKYRQVGKTIFRHSCANRHT